MAGKKQEVIKPVRIPFIGIPLNRDTSTKDQRYVNVMFDSHTNPISQNKRTFVFKRPGQAANTQPPAGAATGRGIYYWNASSKLYTVYNNKIYADTTDLGVTLSGSTGRCWFDETPETFGGGQRLLVSDGVKLYAIQTNNTVTTIDSGSDPQFPTPNLGQVLFFNSYIVLAKSNGEIWNSDADSFTNWTSTSFLAAEMFPDGLRAILRQKDQIIALGGSSLELFFDNANTASPFQRIDQNAIQVGLLSSDTLDQAGDVICFVSTNKKEEYSVWMIDGLSSVNKISTPGIERTLRAASSSTMSAFLMRSMGHLLYVLNLGTANRTLVYDVKEQIWCEWVDSSGNEFNCNFSTEKAGEIYLQDATNGRTYKFSPSTFQDNSSNFTVTLQTSAYDFETTNKKFMPELDVYGDTTTGSLSISWTDDDYTTFSTARTIDLSLTKKRLTRLGQFRKRAFKCTYADNYALRLEGLEVKIKEGLH